MPPNCEMKPWMKPCIVAFGACHALLGTSLFIAPSLTLSASFASDSAAANFLGQWLGAILIVAGLGSLVAAESLCNQKLYLFATTVALFMSFLVCLMGIVDGQLPSLWLWIGAMWSILWAVPMGMIFWEAIRNAHLSGTAFLEPEADDPLRELRTNTGKTLDDLADEKPQMVIFLRHAGCTFCRQTLADIYEVRRQIEATGCGIVFVHLGREDDRRSIEVFRKYRVDDLPRISDPTSRMYRQFGLDLGGFAQLFGLRVWLRGLRFGLVNGHGIGAIRGNSFQMPGVYLYHCGIILGGFRHQRVSDQLDYIALARQISMRSANKQDQRLHEALV